MRIQEAIDELEKIKQEGYEFLSLSTEKSKIYNGLKLEFWQCPYCTVENKLPIRIVDTYIGTR